MNFASVERAYLDPPEPFVLIRPGIGDEATP